MTEDTSLVADSIDAPPRPEDSPTAQHRVRPPIFFAVSPLKLVVMSIVTVGGYELFWFYVNWRRMRRRGMPRISPFWRTMFVYFHCYSLFKTVAQTAHEANLRAKFSPGLMAIGWVVVTLLWKLPGSAWHLSYAAVLFLVPVQKTMNDVNKALYPGHDPNTRFTAWNIVGIALGGSVLALDAVGSFLPD